MEMPLSGPATGLATSRAIELTDDQLPINQATAAQPPLVNRTIRGKAQSFRLPRKDAARADLPGAKKTAQADRARPTEAKIPRRAKAPALILTGILAHTASVAMDDAAAGARNSARSY